MPIRPALPSDLDDLYAICLLTGDAGRDATARYREPRLLGDLYAAPYLHFAPEHAFVDEDEDGVVGYVLGVADTSAFESTLADRWWPRLRERYATAIAAGHEDSADAGPLRQIVDPARTPPEVLLGHPAHLHIDLLPRAQGRGRGRALMTTVLDSLRSAGAAGVHLGVDPANTGAIAFYSRLGFAELATTMPDVRYLTRRLGESVPPTTAT